MVSASEGRLPRFCDHYPPGRVVVLGQGPASRLSFAVIVIALRAPGSCDIQKVCLSLRYCNLRRSLHDACDPDSLVNLIWSVQVVHVGLLLLLLQEVRRLPSR